MANPVAVNNAMSPQAKGMQSPQGYGPPPVMANPVAVNNAMSPQLSPMGFGPNGVNGGSPPVSLRLSAQDFPPNPKGVNRGIPDMFHSPRLSPQDYGTVVNGGSPTVSPQLSPMGFGPNGVNGGSPPVSLRLSAQDFPPNPKGVNRGIPDMFNSPRLSPQDYGTVVNGSPPDLSAPISGRGSPIYSPRFQR